MLLISIKQKKTIKNTVLVLEIPLVAQLLAVFFGVKGVEVIILYPTGKVSV
jgi:hypothetical protein